MTIKAASSQDMREALEACACELGYLIQQLNCRPNGSVARAHAKARAALLLFQPGA